MDVDVADSLAGFIICVGLLIITGVKIDSILSLVGAIALLILGSIVFPLYLTYWDEKELRKDT